MGAVCTQLSIIERWRHAKVPVDEMARVLEGNYFCDESMPKHDGFPDANKCRGSGIAHHRSQYGSTETFLCLWQSNTRSVYTSIDMTTAQNFNMSPHSHVLPPLAQGMAQLLEGITQGATILARQSDPSLVLKEPSPQQWLMCETSGSSGAAKTIRRSPASWQASFAITATRFGIGANDTYATFGTLGHSLTLYAALEALHLGADYIGLAGQSPKRQIEALTTSRATVIYATPSQLALLVRGANGVNLPDPRAIFSGGGKLSDTLRSLLIQIFPTAKIYEFFGASETSFITITDDQTPNGSVGRPYPNVTLRIGDGLTPNQTGEVWVQSPYLFDGYATGNSTDTSWDGPFLSIGEMGYLDESGHLFLRGRLSRMVTVADKNVFPEEIETLISQVDGITQCAAIPLPDPLRGHRIVCVIQSSQPINEAALRQLCHAKLGPASVPKTFHRLTEIPMLAAGKPDLQAPRKMLGDLT